MDDLHTTYSHYYGKLKEFVQGVEYDHSAPTCLVSHLDVLLDIIKPSDSSYSNNNFEDVVKREFLTLDLNVYVLNKMAPFVSNGDWLTNQNSSLNAYINLVKFSLGNHKLEGLGFSEVEGAVAGINKGIYDNSVDSTTLDRVKLLIKCI